MTSWNPTKLLLVAGTALSALGLVPGRADACGCVAPPDPVTPVVQAGERIVFAQKDGVVTAHIQIQYQGSAAEFAWLVPLPSVPKLRLGTEELFAQIEAATAPTFIFNNTSVNCSSGFGFGCSSDNASLDRIADPNQEKPPVVVEAASAGPYDYAVLHADDKAEMLDWLAANRFFIPGGTDTAVEPYIHPGAYFLALKLHAGESAGSIQPVILEYASDFPMVPITLTSVAAAPNMGILVWVLGEHRAIPRNYEHVVINDEHLDWFNKAQNYSQLVQDAIDEADDHHAFVTEFAGSTAPLIGVLDPAGRFPPQESFEARTDLSFYLAEARNTFGWDALLPIIKRRFPMPPEVIARGVTEADYYGDLEAQLRTQTGTIAFDPIALTADIWERLVTPVLESGQLFRDHRQMTRLHTILSPEEMTEDPVFAFNPDLPGVSNVHNASLTYDCDAEISIMTLEDGREIETDASDWYTRERGPKASKVEILREEGRPTPIRGLPPVNREVEGCTSTQASRSSAFSLAMLIASVLVLRRFRSTRT